jgi:hypothetical protein
MRKALAMIVQALLDTFEGPINAIQPLIDSRKSMTIAQPSQHNEQAGKTDGEQ